jgi:hypothetical protein
VRARLLALLLAGALTLVAAPVGQGGPAEAPPAGGPTALPGSAGQGPNLVDNPGFDTVRDGALAGWGLRPETASCGPRCPRGAMAVVPCD